MTAPPPPAGWYPDSSGGQRYWDGQEWGPSLAPGLPQPNQPIPAAAPPQRRKIISLKGLLITAVVLTLGGACVSALTNTTPSSSSRGSSSFTSTGTSTTDTVSQQEIERNQAAEQARLDPSTYKAITPRDFSLIVKDPDSHQGEKVVVYGVVAQFDAATGKDTFRAFTGAVEKEHASQYEQNTIVEASDPSIVKNVVENDMVTMWVEVAGADSYDTQIGGNTTVPKIDVNIIQVTGTGGSISMPTRAASAARSAAKVTIDGKPKEVQGQIACTTAGGNLNIGIGDASTGIAVVMSPDATKVTSVGLGNVNGAVLGFQDGAGGASATATKDGNTYKITGTATGVDMANPTQPLTEPFEIEVTCP